MVRGTWRRVDLIRDKGILVDEYPTDSFDGSNTGDGELYYVPDWKEFWEIDIERSDENPKLLIGKVDDSDGELKKKYGEYLGEL